MSTPKKERMYANNLEMLLCVVREQGWAIIPALMAPYPLSNLVKLGSQPDCMIIVKRDCRKSVDDAESIASTLCESGGHWVSEKYETAQQNTPFPILITYSTKA